MASGTPVVTFKTGGIVESVTTNVGWQVEKGNSQKLADQIKYIFDNEEELKEKTNLCRKYVVENYSEEKMLEEYLQLYKRILQEKE